MYFILQSLEYFTCTVVKYLFIYLFLQLRYILNSSITVVIFSNLDIKSININKCKNIVLNIYG